MIVCVRNVNVGRRKYESNEDQEARSSLGVIHKSLAIIRVPELSASGVHHLIGALKQGMTLESKQLGDFMHLV